MVCDNTLSLISCNRHVLVYCVIYCLDTIGLLSGFVSMAAMQRVIVIHVHCATIHCIATGLLYVMLLICAMLLLLSESRIDGVY